MADPEHRSIGEVLGLLKEEHPDITISKIRFLESQGLISPERTPSGYRKFFEADVDRLRWILEQQRDNFLPLKVIKRRLDSDDPDAAVDPQYLPARLREPTLFSRSDETPTESGSADESVAQTAKRESKSTKAKSSSSGGPVGAIAGSMSLSMGELADTVGVEVPFIDELQKLGLISAVDIDGVAIYDHDAVFIARAAATFAQQGVEPRHLRMFKVAAERQAGMFEQLLGARARRNGEEATLVRAELNELVSLGESIQRSILRRSLGHHLRDQ